MLFIDCTISVVDCNFLWDSCGEVSDFSYYALWKHFKEPFHLWDIIFRLKTSGENLKYLTGLLNRFIPGFDQVINDSSKSYLMKEKIEKLDP